MSLGACSSDEYCELDTNRFEPKDSTDVILVFNLEELSDQLKELDSLESMVVMPEIITSKAASRSSVITPVSGKIENLGNQKTLWTYGVGENLVPWYLCGSTFNDMTISTVYRISVRYDLTDDYMMKGYEGEYSGWNGTYLGNPQTRFQGHKGDTQYIEFYTFVYDIISTIDGYTPPDGGVWVPVKDNEAKLYVRVYE